MHIRPLQTGPFIWRRAGREYMLFLIFRLLLNNSAVLAKFMTFLKTCDFVKDSTILTTARRPTLSAINPHAYMVLHSHVRHDHRRQNSVLTVNVKTDFHLSGTKIKMLLFLGTSS
jgi:hypothetical protein